MGVRTSGSVIPSQGGDTGRLFGPSTESGRASVVHTVVPPQHSSPGPAGSPQIYTPSPQSDLSHLLSASSGSALNQPLCSAAKPVATEVFCVHLSAPPFTQAAAASSPTPSMPQGPCT